jgi:hypothetical protein
MFRTNTAPVEAGEIERRDPGPDHDLVPLSHLKLDLPDQSDWHAYLAGRNIEIVEDDLTRPAIARGAARMLLAEERQREQLRREKAAEAERQAVEADERRRASIWRGLPSEYLPVGASPAAAMLAADRDARPKRTTPLQEALAGESLTYHPLAQTDGE